MWEFACFWIYITVGIALGAVVNFAFKYGPGAVRFIKSFIRWHRG